MHSLINTSTGLFKGIVAAVLIAFIGTMVGPLPAFAQSKQMGTVGQLSPFVLPPPGVMVHLSPPMNPPMLKGIKVHADNPFRFDFILDKGDAFRHPERSEGSKGSLGSFGLRPQDDDALRRQSTRLIKYFLASLTIPEKDLWVNLSPYEKNKIIPTSFGKTEMGRDLLAEDYLLKQITASLIYPEEEIGKKFWKRVYEEAQKKYGTTQVPVNTFNKVWIVPEKAVVYENAKAGTAYVVESKLKVMLEQDYLALQKNSVILSEAKDHNAPKDSSSRLKNVGTQNDINSLGSQIVREVVIPELTKEVNEGKNFAQLRQVYNSLILATWYKKKIKDSILAQVYADKNKVAGVSYNSSVILSEAKGRSKDHNVFLDSSSRLKNVGTQNDTSDVEAIYQRYLQAFKKGVYNYIKEDIDPVTQETIPRKYFSGGVVLSLRDSSMTTSLSTGAALEIEDSPKILPQGEQVGHEMEEVESRINPFTVTANTITTSSKPIIAPVVKQVIPKQNLAPAHVRQFIDKAKKEFQLNNSAFDRIVATLGNRLDLKQAQNLVNIAVLVYLGQLPPKVLDLIDHFAQVKGMDHFLLNAQVKNLKHFPNMMRQLAVAFDLEQRHQYMIVAIEANVANKAVDIIVQNPNKSNASVFEVQLGEGLVNENGQIDTMEALTFLREQIIEHGGLDKLKLEVNENGELTIINQPEKGPASLNLVFGPQFVMKLKELKERNDPKLKGILNRYPNARLRLDAEAALELKQPDVDVFQNINDRVQVIAGGVQDQLKEAQARLAAGFKFPVPVLAPMLRGRLSPSEIRQVLERLGDHSRQAIRQEMARLKVDNGDLQKWGEQKAEELLSRQTLFDEFGDVRTLAIKHQRQSSQKKVNAILQDVKESIQTLPFVSEREMRALHNIDIIAAVRARTFATFLGRYENENRPWILINANLVDALSDSQLRYVIAHEIGHLLMRDVDTVLDEGGYNAVQRREIEAIIEDRCDLLGVWFTSLGSSHDVKGILNTYQVMERLTKEGKISLQASEENMTTDFRDPHRSDGIRVKFLEKLISGISEIQLQQFTTNWPSFFDFEKGIQRTATIIDQRTRVMVMPKQKIDLGNAQLSADHAMNSWPELTYHLNILKQLGGSDALVAANTIIDHFEMIDERSKKNILIKFQETYEQSREERLKSRLVNGLVLLTDYVDLITQNLIWEYLINVLNNPQTSNEVLEQFFNALRFLQNYTQVKISPAILKNMKILLKRSDLSDDILAEIIGVFNDLSNPREVLDIQDLEDLRQKVNISDNLLLYEALGDLFEKFGLQRPPIPRSARAKALRSIVKGFFGDRGEAKEGFVIPPPTPEKMIDDFFKEKKSKVIAISTYAEHEIVGKHLEQLLENAIADGEITHIALPIAESQRGYFNRLLQNRITASEWIKNVSFDILDNDTVYDNEDEAIQFFNALKNMIQTLNRLGVKWIFYDSLGRDTHLSGELTTETILRPIIDAAKAGGKIVMLGKMTSLAKTNLYFEATEQDEMSLVDKLRKEFAENEVISIYVSEESSGFAGINTLVRRVESNKSFGVEITGNLTNIKIDESGSSYRGTLADLADAIIIWKPNDNGGGGENEVENVPPVDSGRIKGKPISVLVEDRAMMSVDRVMLEVSQALRSGRLTSAGIDEQLNKEWQQLGAEYRASSEDQLRKATNANKILIAGFDKSRMFPLVVGNFLKLSKIPTIDMVQEVIFKDAKNKINSIFVAYLRSDSAQLSEQQLADQAMKVREKGGIDLTPANMNLETRLDSRQKLSGMTEEGIKFHLDPSQLQQLQNAPGFVPVIINVQPLTNLREFLGISEKGGNSSGAG